MPRRKRLILLLFAILMLACGMPGGCYSQYPGCEETATTIQERGNANRMLNATAEAER